MTFVRGLPEDALPSVVDADFLSIHVVRVTVEIADAGFGWTDFQAPDGVAVEDLLKLGFETLNTARDAAEEVVEDFVAWARATGDQPWLGLSSESPELAGPVLVVDIDADNRLPIGPSVTLHSGSLRDDSRALRSQGLERLFDAVRKSEKAPLPETFLADAEYLAWEHFPHDPVRAVLMAAIAAEIKVKTNLVERARPEQKPLIEFMLTHHREVTITAVDGLYDQLMKTAQGRSLRDDNRELFKRVHRLFTLRNDIAHSGHVPDLATAQEAVRAARGAIKWVDEGPGGEPNTMTP